MGKASVSARSAMTRSPSFSPRSTAYTPDISVKGKAAHVSTPHLGVDAVYIASQIVVSLQAIVARSLVTSSPASSQMWDGFTRGGAKSSHSTAALPP